MIFSSADFESEDNNHEASGKWRREEDELSISPSDEDINEFLEESNPKEAKVTAKTTEPKREVELQISKGWLHWRWTCCHQNKPMLG